MAGVLAGREIPAGDVAGAAMVMNLDHAGMAELPVLSNEPLRLPPGRYAVAGNVTTPVPGQPLPSRTLVSAPDLTLNKDSAVALDARKGRKVGVRVEKDGAEVFTGTSGLLVDNGVAEGGYATGWIDDLYAVPTTGHVDGFAYYNRMQVEQPLVRLAVDAPEPFEVPVKWVPDSPEVHDPTGFTSVDVGRATPEELAARDLAGKLAVFTLTSGQGREFEARVGAIADAGAAAVLFRFSEPMSISVGETPRIPAVYTTRAEGGRLAALGSAPVRLSGVAASPYRYELAFLHRGAVPATVDYRPKDREFATVQAKYHAMVPGGIAYLDYETEAYGFDLGRGLWSVELPVPVARTEYYSAGPVIWNQSVRTAPNREGGPTQEYQGLPVTYRPGSRQTAAWGAAAVGPSLAADMDRDTGQPHLVARDGDTIRAMLPLLSDSGRHTGYPSPYEYNFADTGDTSLYAGGSLVGSSGVPGSGEFTVPAAATDYRLVSTVSRNHPVWPLSTQVSAEWRFRSERTSAAAPLPLLTVGFTPLVDGLGHAPAGRRITIPVSVDRQNGATGPRPTLDRVEYSFDDGATWVRATPRKQGVCWDVSVPNPAGGFVSLRAAASDRDGNTVTQTILRAYRVQ